MKRGLPACCTENRARAKQQRPTSALIRTCQKGEYRECDPCQYIANIKDKTVTGYKYLDLSDAAGIIASVSGRARGKLRLFTQIDGDCIGEIDIRPNTRRAKTGIRFSLAESALYFRFEGSGKLNLLNFTVTTSKEDNS